MFGADFLADLSIDLYGSTVKVSYSLDMKLLPVVFYCQVFDLSIRQDDGLKLVHETRVFV